MNHLKIRYFSRALALVAALFVATGLRAAENQSSRFLLIFETSPVIKKNLPALRQTLGNLFACNLQDELRTGDDLAVWTVDQSLHPAAFQMVSWDSDEAELYTDRLNEFLGKQQFTRHATLAGIQPALNRVVKSSERLTVLIFCDSEDRLAGTPYDRGVNDTITNTAARLKGPATPFIIVLRAHHGQYIGFSVNRSGRLSFPNFPPPPPQPPPAPVTVTVARTVPFLPPMPVSGPMVTPVPALIIVGTNAGTNLAAVMKAAAQATPEPPPVQTQPAPSPAVLAAPAALPFRPVQTAQPGQPLPAPATAPAATSTVAPGAEPAAPANAQNTLFSNPVAGPAEDESKPSGSSPDLLWFLGGGALAAAAALGLWLVVRARRPRGSLITSSMQNDPLPPRRK